MDEQLQSLQDAFEDNDYDVLEVSRNRSQVRVVLGEGGAEAADLRSVTYEGIDEADVLGVNVTTESVEGQDGMNTVVTVRMRS
ncbi:MAG: hypothetical protein V5A34_03795 [Halapricum sp.]